MFTEPIQPVAGSFPAMSRVDTDNGRSVYRFNNGNGYFHEAVLSRIETKENKTVVTDRYLVEFAQVFPDPNDSTKSIRAAARCVISYPRSVAVGAADVGNCLTALISFFVGALGSTSTTNLASVAGRIFNGET